MPEKSCKIKAYLGFAKKSRQIIFGTDSALAAASKCKLVLVSNLLAENAKNKLENAFKIKAEKVMILNETLMAEIFENENIMVAAITDKNLADIIKKLLDE